MHSHQDQKAVQGKKKRKALAIAPDHSEKCHPKPVELGHAKTNKSMTQHHQS